ncbi:uncharacterized protein ACR2FA_011675 [Aphomia sociella]
MLKSLEVADGSNMCSNSNNNSLQSIKLPTISLPTFDGRYETWIEFRDIFLSLVHNSNEISDIQKFHYLKSSLKGSAELVIDSLAFSSSNYMVAWELLLNRYNNSSLLVHNHVKALFTIQKLSKESPHSLRRLIDIILRNLRALKILGEPTEYWDTLIIFIITSKLDETTEREWEQFNDNVQLADPFHNESQNIDILIGADIFWDLLCEGKIRLPNGPFLQNTKLGWIVSGPIDYSTRNNNNNNTVHCNFTHSFDTQLRRFWELEEVTKFTDIQTDEERACEEFFIVNTTRDNNGRFCVRLPLKHSLSVLEFIREYIDFGHITQVHSYRTAHYFLPHHGVYREHSSTRKLRVVFDANAVTSTGVSFYDI